MRVYSLITVLLMIICVISPAAADELGIDAGAKYEYNTRDDLAKGRISLVYDPTSSGALSFGAYDAVMFDEARGIDAENNVGAGPKYTFVAEGDESELSMSVYYLRQDIKYDTGDTETTARASGRLKAVYGAEKFRAAVTAFYQPNVDDSEDYISKLSADYKYMLDKNRDISLKFNRDYYSASGFTDETIEIEGHWRF